MQGLTIAGVVLSIVGVCFSCYNLGFSVACMRYSDFGIRKEVEKRLKEALDFRCEFCQELRNANSEMTSESNEMTRDAKAI